MIQMKIEITLDPQGQQPDYSTEFWFVPGNAAAELHRATAWVENACAVPAPPVTTPEGGCVFCPDGHRDPRHVPWGVTLSPDRDSDGQPMSMRVERVQGSHCAESDVTWLWELIRDHRDCTENLKKPHPAGREEMNDTPEYNPDAGGPTFKLDFRLEYPGEDPVVDSLYQQGGPREIVKKLRAKADGIDRLYPEPPPEVVNLAKQMLRQALGYAVTTPISWNDLLEEVRQNKKRATHTPLNATIRCQNCEHQDALYNYIFVHSQGEDCWCNPDVHPAGVAHNAVADGRIEEMTS